MKLSNLTFLFSVAVVPLVTVSGTTYKCDNIGIFHGQDDAKHPQVPTKATLNWMADEMLQTFSVSYKDNNDMDMSSERFAKFTMKRERNPDDDDSQDGPDSTSVSLMDDVMNSLRVGRSRRWRAHYYYYFSGYSNIACRWCREDDDYVAASKGYDTIEQALSESEEHKAWENLFCGALKGTKEFDSAFGCKIKLENCVPETPDDSTAGDDITADNYVVSDMRDVVKETDEGVVYTVQTMDSYLAEQSLVTSK